MLSPTGIIPESMMHPEMKKQVIDFLKVQPLPADTKAELLKGWALTVGQYVSAREMKAVERTGVDASYIGTGTYVDPQSLP